MTPRLTVITPTYNRADLLGETIESVLSQAGPHVEYLVLDDGSIDGTPALLAKYAGRLTALRHDNMGEQPTVNRGIAQARGDLCMVVNSDDPLRPGAIAEAIRVMDQNPTLAAAYPDWDEIDEHGQIITQHTAPEFDLAGMLSFHECQPGPGAIMRTRLVQQIGGRDEMYRYVADYDMWLRLALVGPMQRIPTPLATWRHHPGAATNAATGKAMAAEHIRVIRAFFARPDLPPDLRRLRRRAISWAYCAAAYHASPGSLTRLRHSLAWAAIDPINIIRWHRRHATAHPGRNLATHALRRAIGLPT